MKITFNIDYHTNWGESVYIVGDIPALGAGDEKKAVRMTVEGSTAWSVTVETPDTTKDFGYRYVVISEDGRVKREWGAPHLFTCGGKARTYQLYDRWQDQPWDKPYYASAFTDCICRREKRQARVQPKNNYITLSVSAPMVAPGWHVAVSGSSESLGQWAPDKALRMSDGAFPVWTVDIPADDITPDTEFKFLMVDTATGEVVGWEGGENRRFDVEPHKSEVTVISGMRFINMMAPWKGAGVAIPVFSIRSEEDFGVGDFYDIMKMVDWAALTGQKMIQILPINDTTMTGTWTDSYPYNANSTFALHPMYLRLEALGKLKDARRRKYYEKLAAELNDLREIDYERVNAGKTEYVREIFAQEGAGVLKSKEYKDFVTRNSDWLIPYAAFCVLRDRYKTADFSTWETYAVYDAKKVAAFVKENRQEIDFVCYVQYNLDKQLHEVRDYAHSKGVAIKGDIPIGISRTSVDAWINPRLFNMDCQAGAPPDDFSVLGQNWGFPTYNWEEMARDGFAWWKARFRKMAEYFDAYRIDHVLGFFRIWQIPMDAIHGLLGIFNPALPFTPDELRNSYDFWINPENHVKPYIADWFIKEYFADHTDEARRRFLVRMGDGRYRLKPEFDTQRKIADYFATQEKDEKNTRLCNGLLGLVENVLFIEDPYEKGKYHPRISAQFNYAYKALNDYERWCFDRLYNDFFYRRHNDFWYGKAMWKLPPLIDSTDMLVCAEDLGMIPACVPAVMRELEILSLEIQRMPKDPNTEFGDTWSYPYYSVCTTSTHDMGGIRQWWEEDRAASQRFFNNVLHDRGQAPYYAEPWVCDQIVEQHLKSPSMLCILPLQDWLSIDGNLRRENPLEEQINVPANSRHYWRYRMHMTVEALLKANEYNNYLLGKIKESGR